MTRPERSATELATEMTKLLAGFQISQALYAVAKLDIPAALLDGPRPVAELAAQAQVDPDLLRRVLHALTGQGVFTHAPGDAFALTELGATLATGTAGSVRGLAMFWMETHYQPFGALLDVLRSGRTGTELVHGQTFMEFLETHPEHIPSLTAAMADKTSGPQAEILNGYRFPPGTVADIGGADGSVLLSLIADEPDRQAIVFDRPDVVESARARIAEGGHTERIQAIGGDFFESVPPADVYLLSTVLHDWNDENCLRILESIRNAAHPAARLVVLDTILPDGDEPHLGKITDLTMLTMAGGRERTRSEFASLLSSAGFHLDRLIQGADAYSIIEGTLLS
jgi:O-methyltransferase domain